MAMKLKRQFRAASAEDASFDDASNSFEFSFSSEAPVERYFGKEILSHEPGAMDMSRVKAGAAPLLWNHDPNHPIGMIESGDVVGSKGRAKATFFSTPFAQEKKQQVKEGLRNISFGYMVEEMKLTRAGKDGEGDEYTVTKFGVFEISVVSIPADYQVGIGRNADEEFEVRVLNEQPKQPQPQLGEAKMDPKEKEAHEATVRAEAMSAERARITQITALGDKFGQADLARQLIEGGKSIEAAREAVLEKMGKAQKPVTEDAGVVGLSDKEVRQFSFLRAMQAQMFPSDRKIQEAAKFEREVSEATIQTTGKKNARGYVIPVDVLRSALSLDKRDMTVGSATAGGNLVASNLLAGSFIEMLRNKSVLQRAGATMINGLVGNIAIPRQSGGATAYWVAESGSPTEVAQTIDQVTMNPKTLGAFTDYSRKLMLQSSIDIEGFIRADLAKVIALEIDRAGLYGSGSSNQPTGVQNVSGINTVDFSGNAPTYAEIVSMESAIAADNADFGTMAFLTNALGRGVLKGVDKASGAAQFVWENGNTVLGYRAEVSNQVSRVTTSKEHYWLGNWADLLIGMWSGLDLLVDPYTGGAAGTVRVIALQDLDIAVRHPESFCLGSNLT